jgi:tripartite ATP-independent transporter DctM subunit
VALTLGGVALLFALGGMASRHIRWARPGLSAGRLFGIVTNQTLIAVPLFVFMGVMLEKTRIAELLLTSLSELMGRMRGGLGLAVLVVGMLMAASTGIVGATVVTMGLMSLPTMLKQGYDRAWPPASSAPPAPWGRSFPPPSRWCCWATCCPTPISRRSSARGCSRRRPYPSGDLFAGAIVPGLVLVGLYAAYLLTVALVAPAARRRRRCRARTAAAFAAHLLAGLLPPLALIVAVLGSILGGFATPTEAAGVGAAGALLLALARRTLNLEVLRRDLPSTLKTTAMVFFILIGASLFSLVFSGYGGDDLVHAAFVAYARRGVGRAGGHHAADLPAGLHAGLHRDHLRGGTHRRAGAAGHGHGSDLARGADRGEPADLVSDPAVRLRPVLSARRRAGQRNHRRHLPRGAALRRAAAAAAGCMMLAWPALATWLPELLYR